MGQSHLMEFSNLLKIPLKCHWPSQILDNGIEFPFILLKFQQFLIIFTYSGVFSLFPVFLPNAPVWIVMTGGPK